MLGVASMVFRSEETKPAAETPTDATECCRSNSFATSAIV